MRYVNSTGQLSSEGVQILLNIEYNWVVSVSPWKNGTLVNSSINMQPTDHMSKAAV